MTQEVSESEALEVLEESVEVSGVVEAPIVGSPSLLKPFAFSSLLASERRVDYIKLRELLEEQQWQTANEETERVMLQVSRRRRDGWLDGEAKARFSQKDLQTIDRLWMHYSRDRFGFTTQAQIFLEVHTEETAFLEKVAWKRAALYGGLLNGLSDKFSENLQFNLSAPTGHLPFVFCGEHCWIFERLKHV